MSLSSIEALPILQSNTAKISQDIFFVPEFEKDTEYLNEKFETLGTDLKIFIETSLKLYHDLNIDNEGIKPLRSPNIKNAKIYEAVKFACRSLKGKGAKSGIRVIYAHFEEQKRIELIEMYYKEEKQDQDLGRVLKYYH